MPKFLVTRKWLIEAPTAGDAIEKTHGTQHSDVSAQKVPDYWMFPALPGTSASEVSQAPWTNDEVKSLVGYQKSGRFHPFTCAVDHDEERVLLPTKEGWMCSDLSCSYKQTWAHAWMSDWSWRDAFK